MDERRGRRGGRWTAPAEVPGAVRAGLRDAVGLVLPVRCGGCAAPGAAWCPGCRRAAGVPLPGSGPVPGADPQVWAATACAGPVRLAVTAHKDAGRADLRPELAGLLATAMHRALVTDPGLRAARPDGTVLVVPVPTSRRAGRRRGEDAVAALTATATRRLGDPSLTCRPVLRHTRPVADQTALGRAARAANLAGSMAVRAADLRLLDHAVCLLVDDVVTTGATLAEAARALQAAGAVHVVAAVVGATPPTTSRARVSA
ncbi:ComF family protein [Phycicoccus sp. MAQZ13P-2]|uniref:ComF family protein n=1 Tax=Phycicoccus mangrovi TaxID=2840470 RepID=UPI001C004ECC|nr:phosphoribosyltransferase family protein [Phycicoccus mangrovi]MBT9255896.1 ComF family protein [Phycicoccus mangrovi]MBT9274490.1 ComF family protein [Phycicoccus mangrovi]